MHSNVLYSKSAPFLLICLVPFIACSPSFAQDSQAPISRTNGFVADLNVAKIAERTGTEFAIGYAFRSSRLELIPSIGAFLSPNEDDQFENQTFRNGQTVCRDLSNGQFSNEENCGPEVAAFGKIEVNFLATEKFSLGIGGYISDEATAFGRIAYKFTDKVSLQASGGENYASLGIRFGF
jgi:hypothetical protein